MKKEIPYLHLIRVVAVLMVICLHCLPSAWLIEGIDKTFYAVVFFLTRPCVPLFFMISGVLLLPMENDIICFYKKRLAKIVYPLLAWGVVYSILPYLMGLETIKEAVIQCISIPITMPGRFGGILWYLYILIGIYLMIPFINQKIFLKGYKIYLYVYLLAWLLASGVDLLHCYGIDVLGARSFSSYHLLTYFSGYLGFCFLGNYLHQYPIRLNKYAIGIFIVLIFLSFILLWNRSELNHLYIEGFLSWGSISLSIISFTLLSKVVIRNIYLYKIIKHISKLSFGIYLSHIVIYNTLIKGLYGISTSIFMQVLVMLLTITGSYLLVWLLSKLPFSKFVIGV